MTGKQPYQHMNVYFERAFCYRLESPNIVMFSCIVVVDFHFLQAYKWRFRELSVAKDAKQQLFQHCRSGRVVLL